MRLAFIPGTDGYLASDDGQIFRPIKGGWKKAAAYRDCDDYLCCHIRIGGVERRIRVHRMVLEAFAGPKPDGYVGRHLDDHLWNNHIDNLEWGTPAENNADRAHNSKRKAPGKLDAARVVSIKHAIAQGIPLSQIAKRYRVRLYTIQLISYGKTHKHINAGQRTRITE